MTCGEIAPKFRRDINFANIGLPIVPIANRLVYSTAIGLALLPTGNNGVLITSGSGVPSVSSTLPSAVQLNITNVNTITTGSWNAPGFIRVNGATGVGIDCLGNAGTANIGATVTSNTSGHHARLYAEMDGNNSGQDPFCNFKNVNTSIDYAIGYDTSATAFVLSKSATLGGNNIFSVLDSTLVTTFGSGDLKVGRSTSGATVGLTCQNTSNTASSAATITASVGGGSAGDPSIVFDISGADDWAIGPDNSDSDAFVIAASGTLGTTNIMRAQVTGEINYPLQSAFMAYLNSADNNVTGDGTFYNIGTNVALIKVFDQNSDFNTNGTFTAPVTGRYLFTGVMQLGQLAAAFTAVYVGISTSNSSYVGLGTNGNARDSNNNLQCNFSLFVDMDAADTASFLTGVFGSTKTVDILNGRGTTVFSGHLVC